MPANIDKTQKDIRWLKHNKGPGFRNRRNRSWTGGARLENEVHRIVTDVWDSESMPSDWNLGIIYPIYKKEDRLDCNNYRGIIV